MKDTSQGPYMIGGQEEWLSFMNRVRVAMNEEFGEEIREKKRVELNFKCDPSIRPLEARYEIHKNDVYRAGCIYMGIIAFTIFRNYIAPQVPGGFREVKVHELN